MDILLSVIITESKPVCTNIWLHPELISCLLKACHCNSSAVYANGYKVWGSVRVHHWAGKWEMKDMNQFHCLNVSVSSRLSSLNVSNLSDCYQETSIRQQNGSAEGVWVRPLHSTTSSVIIFITPRVTGRVWQLQGDMNTTCCIKQDGKVLRPLQLVLRPLQLVLGSLQVVPRPGVFFRWVPVSPGVFSRCPCESVHCKPSESVCVRRGFSMGVSAVCVGCSSASNTLLVWFMSQCWTTFRPLV